MCRDVNIRHIGEAKGRLAVAFNSVMDRIEPFVEMLKSSYNDDFDIHFKDINEMWGCVGKCFGISEQKLDIIKVSAGQSVDNRADVANAMVEAALDMDLDAAEEIQLAAGMLIMNGWMPVRRCLTEAK